MKTKANVMNTLTRQIERWAVERDLHTQDPHKQFVKLAEELGELAEGLSKSNDKLIIDGIGDVYVVLTILSMQLGLKVSDCVEVAYNEIKDRQGEMVNGVFVKMEDIKA